MRVRAAVVAGLGLSSVVALGAAAAILRGQLGDGTPGDREASDTPSPSSAARGLDYASAQAQVPFHLLVPTKAPTGFHLASIRVSEENGSLTVFQLFVTDPPGHRSPEIAVAQSTAPFPVPAVASAVVLDLPTVATPQVFRMPSASAPHMIATWAEPDSYIRVTGTNVADEVPLLGSMVAQLAEWEP